MTMTIDKPSGETLPAIHPPRLPYHPAIEERFGIDRASWKALVEAIFPNATTTESVVLALSYCRARKLDPFKRNVHIVPIWNRDQKCLVDTIWPGIGELRTTAFRTGEYAGRDAAVFGPDITERLGSTEVTFPEWAQVTVYRLVKGIRVAFAGPRVYWIETYATASRSDDAPNEMWRNRKRGQIEKCAEAASLRAAFPEEIGTDYIADEVQHDRTRQVDSTPVGEKKPGAQALVARLKARVLPDTQLSDEEAEAIIQQKAAQANNPEPPADATEEPEESEPEREHSHWPDTMPEHARTSMAWMDDLIAERKGALTMKQAKVAFARQHAPKSWPALTPDEQDGLYAALRDVDGILESVREAK